MRPIVFLIVLVAVVGSQTNGLYVRPDSRDIWSDTRLIFSQLQNTVLTSITSGLSKVLAMIESLRTTQQAQIDRGHSLVTTAYDNFLLKTKALKDKATQAGVDVLNCTSSQEVRLRRLPELVEVQFEECLHENFNQGINIVEESVKRLEGTQNTVNALGTKLDKCVNVEDESECLLEVSDEIQLRIADIPMTITEESAKTSELVAVVEKYYTACVTNRYAIVNTEGTLLLNQMTECVNSEIEKSQTTLPPSTTITVTPSPPTTIATPPPNVVNF